MLQRRFAQALKRPSALLAVLLLLTAAAAAYPIDGHIVTGIRRLLRLSLIQDGVLKGTLPPPGGMAGMGDIQLNLSGARGDSLATLPPAHPALQKEIATLFPNRDESYGLALLDIRPGRAPRAAYHKADRQYNPGSVGKLAIAAGLFAELARRYPDDPARRIALLRSREVVADAWSQPNHHEVPVFDPATRAFAARAVRVGDRFTLYEWLDHMLSASSNAAASMVWKEIILMRAFGEAYPPTPEQADAWFAATPRDTLRTLAVSLVNDPLRTVGITENEWQLGSLFTATAKRAVPGETSYATPTAMLKYLVAVERGKLVDAWSSLEIKRMMYMTARRIRYASAPGLGDSRVYYKSGSLYRCQPEEGFTCGKYMGNVVNYMNSVGIVEGPDGRTYLVALMSNVLRKNSAVEHQTLATYIDRIIRRSAPPPQ